MKATALLTPLLVLGLLLVMPRLEVWAQHPGATEHRPRRKGRPMPSPATSHTHDAPEAPLLRDPPPPPGYVEPLAGSSAEETTLQQASSAQHGERPPQVSTTGSGL